MAARGELENGNNFFFLSLDGSVKIFAPSLGKSLKQNNQRSKIVINHERIIKRAGFLEMTQIFVSGIKSYFPSDGGNATTKYKDFPLKKECERLEFSLNIPQKQKRCIQNVS